MKFSMVVMLTVSQVSAQFSTRWHQAGHGGMLSCETDQAVTGVCTSGENKDCRGTTGGDVSHKIRCHSGENLFDDGGTGNWIERKWGNWAICPAGSMAIQRCAGGKNADCKMVNNEDWHHALRCKAPRANWTVLEDTVVWRCGDHGVDVTCPTGYVVTESCGSGKNQDCDNRGCAGQKASSGIKCNRLVDETDVRLSSYDPEGTVVVRAARPNDNVEHALGQPVCDLTYHHTQGEETLTFNDAYQVQTGYEVTTTASSSQTTNVKTTWSSEIGVSKGPFSGSFGSETSFAGEWTTLSATVEGRTMHTTTTSSVQREVTLPAGAYYARASFVVLATLTATVSADLSRIAFTNTYTDEASAAYYEVSPAAYSLIVDLREHANLIGFVSCESFVSELFTSGTINDLNAGLHLL